MQLILHSLSDLTSQGVPWLLTALAGRRKVALYGEMGAGKTTLVKAFCRQLGVAENTASPTFSLINEYGYTDENGQAALVHHLDLYRLRSAEEAYDIGLEDLLYDPWYCFIEWPEIVEPLLPPEMVKIQLSVTEGETRRLFVL